jgi:hypothetical protein
MSHGVSTLLGVATQSRIDTVGPGGEALLDVPGESLRPELTI